MKQRKWMLLIAFLMLYGFVLIGCSAQDHDKYDPGYNENPVDEEAIEAISHEERRKLIFEASLDLETTDLSGVVSTIRSELEEGEWLDKERIEPYRASFTVRVKTERLDRYLQAIQDGQTVKKYDKKATDITVKYQEKSNLLLSYQLERDRLIELYENASLSDMLTINSRLSQIDVQMRNLNGELAEYDSLLEYSTVHIRIDLRMGEVEDEDEESFGQYLGSSFKKGWTSLISFFQFILIILVTIAPWLVVIVPTVLIITYFVRRANKRVITPNANETEKKH